MAVNIEKSPMDLEEGRSSRDTASGISAVNGVDEINATQEKSNHKVPDEQYPHGLKLVLLAGSSIVAVFLIALDQVSE